MPHILHQSRLHFYATLIILIIHPCFLEDLQDEEQPLLVNHQAKFQVLFAKKGTEYAFFQKKAGKGFTKSFFCGII